MKKILCSYYPFGLTHKGYNTQKRGRTHNYGYNGKEENDELGLATLDYGARNYSPDLGKWMNIDPLADKYYEFSPYNYVANNPLIFIDPDGKEIVVAQGSLNNKQFARLKAKVLTNLQALTNDKLAFKGNTLIITKLGGANSGKDLSFGTELIRSQNNKQEGHKTTTIEFSSTKNSTRGEKGKKDEVLNKDGSNGKGENATVRFNPNKRTGGLDVKGNRIRPTQIGLGHELLHADSINKGKVDKSSSGKQDQDTKKKKILPKEEYNARVNENKLRKEQNATARKI